LFLLIDQCLLINRLHDNVLLDIRFPLFLQLHREKTVHKPVLDWRADGKRLCLIDQHRNDCNLHDVFFCRIIFLSNT